MSKNPYLFRRGNILYFRIAVPFKLRAILKVSELSQSLVTQDLKTAIPAAYALASEAISLFNYSDTLMTEKDPTGDLIAKIDLDKYESQLSDAIFNKPTGLRKLLADKRRDIAKDFKIESLESGYEALESKHKLELALLETRVKAESLDKLSSLKPVAEKKSKSPKLSVVIEDFLERYDHSKSSMLTKLKGALPIFLELITDKPVSQILQGDVNNFFDLVQKLPVKRDAAKFRRMNILQIIEKNGKDKGHCIAEKTFKSAYIASVSVLIEWAKVNYADQGFPSLSVDGAIYRGKRMAGINKQRALKPEELKILFGHDLMRGFAANPKTANNCWLPLIGLYSGARINEISQLNPNADIVKDADTGIYYFHFTDEGLDQKLKTRASKRIVPIHSKLLELGFLDYVKRVRAGKHTIIFPEWLPRNGRAGSNSTKWFSRYLIDAGLKDETVGARLAGFHAFRHTFITHAINNGIDNFQAITGHEEGLGLSSVVKGYWTRGLTDGIQEKQITIEKFDFGIEFFKPSYILNCSKSGSGNVGKRVVISESGLYSLAIASRKPEAKAFKKWVTAEVLPAIRKTGSYQAPISSGNLKWNSAAVTERYNRNTSRLLAA